MWNVHGQQKKDVQEKYAPRPLWKFCHTKLPTPACLLPNNDRESMAALLCSSALNSALALHRKKTHCHSCPPPLLGLLKEEAKDLESKTPEGVLEYICDMYGPETVRKEIERLTRGHQSAPAWHKYRKGLVTASIAHACMTRAKIYLRAKATPNIAPFPSLILRTSHVSTPAMRAGSAKEDAARNTYVQWQEAQGHKVELQQTGLILRCDLPFIGCSPDGRVTFPCQCCEGKEVLKCL
ncbi:uncharacterized protein LOC144121522 isoform X4 [Amblyomma americanum]